MPSSTSRSGDMGFRSLFLPTASTESAIFAACVPLLSESIHAARPPSVSPAREPSPLSSPSVFSPASPRAGTENGAEAIEMRAVPSATVASKRDGTTTAAAPLFALLSGRVDAAMVVLRNRHIVFFGLRDGKLGPKELRRLRPTPTVAKDGTPATSTTATATATCAALIPLDVAALCATQSHRTGTAVYLRGVVGTSDGRVSAFSESGYAFGFTAHAGSVSRVEPVYLGFPSAPTSSTTSAEARTASDGDGASLYHVTAQLGFVTAGEDRRVFLWCRQAGAMQLTPRALLEAEVSEAFACVGAFAVLQPRLTRHVVCVGGAMTTTPPLPAELVYATRESQPVGVWRTLIQRSAARADRSSSPSSSASSSLLRAISTSVVDPRKVTAMTMSAGRDVCLVACGPSVYRVDLVASATGPAPARGKDVRPPPVKLPVPGSADVTDLIVHGRLVLAVCAGAGLIHVLALGDTPNSVAWLGRHVLYEQRCVRSVTLHARACLMTVVDDVAGSVELVRLPDACLGPLMQDEEALAPESIFASAAALRHKCVQEDLVAGAVLAETPTARAVKALSPTGVERELEAELLARLLVPSACDQYLHPSQAVL